MIDKKKIYLSLDKTIYNWNRPVNYRFDIIPPEELADNLVSYLTVEGNMKKISISMDEILSFIHCIALINEYSHDAIKPLQEEAQKLYAILKEN